MRRFYLDTKHDCTQSKKKQQHIFTGFDMNKRQCFPQIHKPLYNINTYSYIKNGHRCIKHQYCEKKKRIMDKH